MAQKNLPELAWPGRPGGISFGSVPRDAQMDFWGGQKSTPDLAGSNLGPVGRVGEGCCTAGLHQLVERPDPHGVAPKLTFSGRICAPAEGIPPGAASS